IELDYIKIEKIENKRIRAHAGTYDLYAIVEGIFTILQKGQETLRKEFEATSQRGLFKGEEWPNVADKLKELDEFVGQTWCKEGYVEKTEDLDTIERINAQRAKETERYLEELEKVRTGIIDITRDMESRGLAVNEMQAIVIRLVDVMNKIEFSFTQKEAVAIFVGLYDSFGRFVEEKINSVGVDDETKIALGNFLVVYQQELAYLGVALIGQVGEEFDENKHQSVEETSLGTVKKVQSSGFSLNGTIVKKAKVELV
ncbi:MAG: hypothetical protein J6R44_02480, partial [Clostridia bacterium]|nr:hypothetical protein [Clostridia bacterium]